MMLFTTLSMNKLRGAFGMLNKFRSLKQYSRIVMFIYFISIFSLLIGCNQDNIPNKVFDEDELESVLPLTYLWSTDFDQPLMVTPKANQDLVVALRKDSSLIAFHNESGNVAWEYSIGEEIGHPSSESVFDLDQENLLISNGRDQLIALDVTTGQERWRKTMSSFATSSAPDITIINDIVIVSIFITELETGGNNIMAYDINSGDVLWTLSLPSRTYDHTFACPYLPTNNGSKPDTVCISLSDRIVVIDPDPELRYHERIDKTVMTPVYSYNVPIYTHQHIFTNPSPKPANEFFSFETYRINTLPANCSVDLIAYPVTNADSDQVLVSNSCGELYVLPSMNPESDLAWVYKIESPPASSLVSTDGVIGYVLDMDGYITGINLENGETVGKAYLEKVEQIKRELWSTLTTKAPYVYTFLNGKHLRVFSSE